MENRPLTFSLLTLALVSMSLAAIPRTAAAVQGPPGGLTYVDVDLPSEGAGGGTLALRIFPPATSRYPEGAPVVVFAAGADSAGDVGPELRRADQAIRIVYIHPGGRDAVNGRASDGFYDNRGPNCIAALRDVVLFAAGRLRDDRNRSIDDVLDVPVLHDNIGLFGSSNGGNIVVAVAARYGAALAGSLRYLVQWESPVSSQVATLDMGPGRLDCSGGPGGPPPTAGSVNPWYDPSGFTDYTLYIDYSKIAYDPSDTAHPIFLDGSGDGRYTTAEDPRNPGCRTPDLDLDGMLETDEDFPLSSYSSGTRRVYSRPATVALEASGLAGQLPSATFLSPSEAAAYWDDREAVRLYDEASVELPEMEGMVLCSLVDHVQTATIDKPHSRQAFNGWRRNGRHVRINPSRAAILEVDPSLAGRTDLPDMPDDTAPSDWGDPDTYAYPDTLEPVVQAAAVYEMADRARARSGDTAAPAVTVLSPDGGEKFRRGEAISITWEASDETGIESQTLEAVSSTGESFAIASGLDGTVRTYSWTVPADTPKGRYRIRVTATDATGHTGEDSSDRRFKIRRAAA